MILCANGRSQCECCELDTPVAVDKGAVSVQALEMAVVELILEEAAVRRGSTAAQDAPARRVAADEYLFGEPQSGGQKCYVADDPAIRNHRTTREAP